MTRLYSIDNVVKQIRRAILCELMYRFILILPSFLITRMNVFVAKIHVLETTLVYACV